MTSKKQREAERAEALENIRDALQACGPDGDATLLIIDDGGRPSNSGRTHKLELHVIRSVQVSLPRGVKATPMNDERPTIREYLTINVARLLGVRLAKDDRILMGGYGYSRSLELATALARKAGHPIHVETIGGSFGARGWIGERKA